jgi:hypothetical protein
MIDNKLRILNAVKKVWGERVITVFARQGHYARDPQFLAGCPPADIQLDHLGDLNNYPLAAFRSEAARVTLGQINQGVQRTLNATKALSRSRCVSAVNREDLEDRPQPMRRYGPIIRGEPDHHGNNRSPRPDVAVGSDIHRPPAPSWHRSNPIIASCTTSFPIRAVLRPAAVPWRR